MYYQPSYNVSHNRGFNGGKRVHALSQASNASMYQPKGPNGTEMEARNSPIGRSQWTLPTVAAHHHVDGQGVPGAAHRVVTDQCDMPPSAEYRLAEMRMAFAASGGLLTVGELANGSDPDSQARFAQIAKGIAAREIIGFMWQSEPWVPMFQFEFEPDSRLTPRRALQPLFKLLIPLYDAWDMAHWFARPNQWLSGLRPVDQCTDHLEAVLDVAHLEYFIATGKAHRQLSIVPSNHGNAS